MRSAAPGAPMPLAALNTPSALSPTMLAALPVKLSLMAPPVLVTVALAPTSTLLRAMFPPAVSVAWPPVPNELVSVPSAIVMVVPAVKVI